MKMNIYYIDGQYVPADKAVVPADDLALLRGIGVFELLRTYGRQAFAMERHIDRLFVSGAHLGLTLPWSKDDVCAIITETLTRNPDGDWNLRVVVTAGSSPDFMTPQGKPRLLVLVTPLPQQPPWWYEKGIAVITVEDERHMPNAKSTNYIPATLAMQKARAAGAVEAVYLDRDQNVREGTVSNIFAFYGKCLKTPAKNILKGITRAEILEVAAADFDIETGQLPLAELLTADEVFITGTNKGIVPVVRVNAAVIGTGVPGPNTRHLMALLKCEERAFK